MERGSVQTLRLARAFFEMVSDALLMEMLNLVIDEALIPHQSEKTLDSVGGKYVLSIVSRSVPATGYRIKLTNALALVRSLRPVI